jgi:T5SS/PEP-CTERM-associated repeat protein
LDLGYLSGSKGTYNLSGTGIVSAPNEHVGYSGTGTFNQSGGTNNVSSALYLGYSNGATGAYALSGTGQLSAAAEYVGYSGNKASFQQTGGTNTVTNLAIGPGGIYQLTGGTLQVNGSLVNQGVVDGGNSPATFGANCLVDLTAGTWKNYSDWSVNVGANGLLIIPAGFNPSTAFAGITTAGLPVHVAGTPLAVPAGQGFSGSGSISDPVVCQGTIAASGGPLSLNNGLVLSGSGGNVSLGSGGSLTVNDAVSGMSAGSLSMSNQYVGSGGTGQFAQSGGSTSVTNVYLGYNSADSGTYTLSGTGKSGVYTQYVGYSGTGTFVQSAGTNTINGTLYLGCNSGATGAYTLTGGTLTLPYYSEFVGNSGTGTLTQSGGTNSDTDGSLYVGNNAGSSGMYNLSGGALSMSFEDVGCSGTGNFTHSAGYNTTGSLTVGDAAGAAGTYSLSGTGQLSTATETVGNSGTGTFTQSGGVNTVSSNLYLGNNAGSSGAYNLSGTGRITGPNEYAGYNGKGVFSQTGGSNTISGALYIGYNSGSNGSYALSGTGQLTAANEYVGYSSAAAASFQQTGGTNTVSNLSIGSAGTYELAGGTLQINGGIVNQGTFNGDNSPGTLNANCIVNLTAGTWENLGSTTVNLGANSLLVAPAGFNPATFFGSYNSLGLTYTIGAPLQVPAGKGFTGSFSFNDQVVCQGTITASGGSINLNNGLVLSGSGSVNLGSNGILTVNDTTSGISGGTLSTYQQYVGKGGTGSFAHTGGTNTIADSLFLGYNSADSGTYTLSGTNSRLSAANQQVGYSGAGTLSQTAGSNTVSNTLYLGSNATGNGTYNLSGTGQLSAVTEFVGNSGSGAFVQSAGNNSVAGVANSEYVANGLLLGANSNGKGTYTLSGTGVLSAGMEGVGYAGTGTFTQTGGTNTLPTNYLNSCIYLGYNAGATGIYNLSGTGQIVATNNYTWATVEYIGYSGTGVFNQTAGSNLMSISSLYLGYNTTGVGTYNLSGTGQLGDQTTYDGYQGMEVVGYSGTGTFNQSGGTNTLINNGPATASLYLGFNSGAKGTYSLSGTGQLTASNEYIGYNSAATGLFQQTGGTNTVGNLSIGPGGTYQLAGGTLQINGGFINQGTFDGGNSPADLSANCIVDLTTGTWRNLEDTAVSLGANSLLVAPAGFNPSTYFGSYNSLGLTYVHGTTLVVPAGRGFTGSININDPVNCQGTMTASGGPINLNDGLVLSGSGNVTLSGSLLVNDAVSNVSGGSLSSAACYIGKGGTGTFTHSGGEISSLSVYLGYNSADRGAYNLSGTGSLWTEASEYVGYSGAGSFTQSGGTNSISDNLFLGYNTGSTGAYTLSGGNVSLSTTSNQYVGYYGTGTYTQSGGTNASVGYLVLGQYAGSSGTFNLDGGTFAISSIGKGSGTATFNFGGGTLSTYYNFSTSLPMTLTGTGGNANLSCTTYPATLSGVLSGVGGLNKLGTNTLTLSAANTFAGNTTVSGGTLILANAAALQDSTLDYNAYGGSLSFGSLTTATLGGLQGSQNLALANSASAALGLLVGNDNQSTVYSGALSGAGSLTKLGSGMLTLDGADSFTGLTTVKAGTLALGPSAQNAVLALGGADLQGGQLLFDYSGTSPAATIESILAAGYAGNFAPGSACIYSSTAAANGWVLGWADNGAGVVTVAPVLPGDANLDGRVDINDLSVVLTNFGGTGMTWAQGDFTYSGQVDVNDLTIVLANFDRALAAPPSAAGFTSVPEPSTLLLLALALLALLPLAARRRRPM